jgi:hypothetical protein
VSLTLCRYMGMTLARFLPVEKGLEMKGLKQEDIESPCERYDIIIR